MIIEINKDNLSILDNSFLSKELVLSNLENNPFGKYLVLVENNIVIAYIYYSDIYERIEIDQIEVETSHRNCGKGAKILNYLLKAVDKNITLEVKCTNEAALKLYKKVGFKKVAIRKGYYQGIDGILMEKEIN